MRNIKSSSTPTSLILQLTVRDEGFPFISSHHWISKFNTLRYQLQEPYGEGC